MRKISILLFALAAGCATFPPRDFGAFVDSVMRREMQRDGIPGAAFVFVRDGRVVYMKGYGVADDASGRPVDPERTIWRIGSITKTFTATAVMQLVERGQVQLQADVNDYLAGVRVPATYPLPVTVADLLMHTAGFDEIRPGTHAASEREVLPLAAFLGPRLVRVRPPGSTIVYSTYGMTLAGLLIEEVTHERYDEYVRKHVTAPLGMTRTMIAVPEALHGDVAVGYERKNGALVAQPWEWYHTTPASSLNSTAADMARYLIAHLRSQPEMLRQQHTMDARMPGVTLGFFEDYVGSLRVVEHGGNMAGFSAQLTMIPDDRAGFFIVHHFEGSHLRDNVKEEILRKLYPAARTRKPVPPPPADFAARAAAFAGRYVPMTSCHSCQPRSASMILEVTAEGDALRFSGKRWIEVAPLAFVREDGTGIIVFRTDEKGEVATMLPGGFWSFEKVR